jgi:RimJ/RimL family protein N-acetyltransferase
MTDYAFDELRQHRVSARVFGFNEASRALFEDTLGYRHEGVHREETYIDGEYRDVHYYGVLESEW